VHGTITDGVAIPSYPVGWGATYPETSRGPVDVLDPPTQSLSPGRNDLVSVKPDRTLQLTTGVYYFDGLQVERDAHVVLDESAGPVEVYVKDEFTFRGTVATMNGAHPEWAVVSFGSQMVVLETSFQGTVVAPTARITLGSAPGGHSGAFFAKEIEVQPDTTVLHHPSSALSPVRPIASCVRDLGGGTYEAVFGYENDSLEKMLIQVGPRNLVSPGAAGAGQPVTILPQRVERAFAARFTGPALSWTLEGRTATITPAAPPCPADPCGACGPAASCIGSVCIPVCGDGHCSMKESCQICPTDCGCQGGELCLSRGGCAAPIRCGVDWMCGTGDFFGSPVDCGTCPSGQSCVAHVCI
jgi:hypothetical protein